MESTAQTGHGPFGARKSAPTTHRGRVQCIAQGALLARFRNRAGYETQIRWLDALAHGDRGLWGRVEKGRRWFRSLPIDTQVAVADALGMGLRRLRALLYREGRAALNTSEGRDPPMSLMVAVVPHQELVAFTRAAEASGVTLDDAILCLIRLAGGETADIADAAWLKPRSPAMRRLLAEHAVNVAQRLLDQADQDAPPGRSPHPRKRRLSP